MHLLAGYIEDVKLIRDPIYGFISVPLDFLPILDNEFMQRLRWVSQLPLEQLVYPSAVHSRFEHSLGCMYLSMFAAISLIKDSKKQKNSKLKEAFKKDLCNEKDFICAAGLVGLLHDLGHAPFSHTLEEVGIYTRFGKFYDHEKVTIDIAQKILSEFCKKKFVQLALNALNKALDSTQAPPLSIILRNLIDGSSIDVDKGDYLLRDSYHCGVSYGVYDYRRLWGNLTIDPNSRIAVTEKSALEAWSLMVARHKMFINTYKHHVRDLSDALLINIIASVYEANQNIIPTKNNKLTDATGADFLFWTDDNFLKTLHDSNVENVKKLVQNFKKRNLYKRCEDINLSNSMKASQAFNLKLAEAQKKLNEMHINTMFIISTQSIIPIRTTSVNSLSVRKKDNSFVSLAKYLELTSNKEDLEDSIEAVHNTSPSDKPVLRIFMDEINEDKKDVIIDIYKQSISSFQLQ